MLICHCHEVTDEQIRACVRRGAASAEDVKLACSAGRECGGCRPLVEHLVRAEQASMRVEAEVA